MDESGRRRTRLRRLLSLGARWGTQDSVQTDPGSDASTDPVNPRRRVADGEAELQFTAEDIRRARREGYVRFSGWGIKSLPPQISQLGDLERLYLIHNELVTLPADISHLVSLTELDVRHNYLTALPPEIGDLGKLEELYLDENILDTLPPEIGNLRRLRILDLDGNHITVLPDGFFGLRSLEQLDLRNNRLTSLPSGIGRLTNLRRLYLDNNKLIHLPPEIGQLTRLEKLELDGNQLRELPREIIQLLSRPITISIDRNPLDDPLPELVSRGWDAVASYLRSLEDAVPQYEAKILIVGEGNVGKTSLLAALRGEPFVMNRETTHGLEIHPLILKHPDLDLDITVRAWDFGGQELYRITHQFFFSRRALYILVWNAREGHEQNEVEGWLRRIRLRVGPEARALLVPTHCDERHPEIDYAALDRAFPGMLAGQFLVDNMSGKGINDLRRAIAREAAALPQMGRMLSPRWIAARDEVLSRYQEEPQIAFDDFVTACSRNALDDVETITLAELLHDLGQIIYYGDDDGLRDIVVLNPEWLTKAIAYVLEDEITRNAHGVLIHARLHEIWRDKLPGGYDSRHYPYFLRLMEKFDICYRLEDRHKLSLVAQLVPFPKPAVPWSFSTPTSAGIRKLTVLCRLREPAPGLISWLTVRHHSASLGKHWRNGVFLRHPVSAYASEALIEMESERRLLVEVRAPSPDMFFNVLVDSIEHLLRLRWPGLRYQLLVPCTTPSCTGEFPLDGLLRRLQAMRNTRDCLECDREFNIPELLTGFPGSQREIRVELSWLNDEIAEITNGIQRIEGSVSRIEALATQSAHSLRRVLKIVSTEVIDCPRIFTMAPPPRTSLRELARVTTDAIILTLWCEHPGEWHPWQAASYELRHEKEWVESLAPYVNFVLRSLRLVVPIASAVAGVVLPKPDVEDLSRQIDLMKAVAEKLPAEITRYGSPEQHQDGQMTVAEGAALRAFRALLFRYDEARSFGDLRRVQAPSGEILWACPVHHQEYDPGLPTIPPNAEG